MKNKHKREGNGLFHFINYFILTLVFLIVAYPLYFVLIASISDPSMVGTGQVILFPKKITFEGYKGVFANNQILNGYKNSIIYTVVGVLFSVAATVPAAYALSRRSLPGRKMLMILIVFTMYFSGGMIPTYLVVNNLNLTNSLWSLVLPAMIVPYNLIIARTFFESSLPDEIREAAMLDGCTEFKYFTKVVMPLSGAIVAIMILFYGVAQWNTYFNALLYIKDQILYPLQLVLRNILIQNQVPADMVGDVAQAAIRAQRAELIKYVSIIVSAAPLLILYPFVQKHFVKGVMVGSVKG